MAEEGEIGRLAAREASRRSLINSIEGYAEHATSAKIWQFKHAQLGPSAPRWQVAIEIQERRPGDKEPKLYECYVMVDLDEEIKRRGGVKAAKAAIYAQLADAIAEGLAKGVITQAAHDVAMSLVTP